MAYYKGGKFIVRFLLMLGVFAKKIMVLVKKKHRKPDFRLN